MRAGLVGGKLGHSFSKPIHEKLADYTYDLIPLTEEEFHEFFRKKEFDAVNVTIPYKEKVMQYCDVIDEKASAIHAVNTIVNRDGKLYATNTDFAGLKQMIQHNGVEICGKVCCILGTGGTSKTAEAVLHDMGAEKIYIAGRNKTAPVISYEDLERYQEIQVFVNATSVGMYPNNEECLIDLKKFPNVEAVVDVIYNPLKTRICQQAEAMGLRAVNGLEMLVAQAKYAVEFFLDTEIADSETDRIVAEMKKDMMNLVLIGMPGCGKSTIGKKTAKEIGKKFIDLDKEIEKEAKRTIPEIFEKYGEERFRQIEKEVCARIAKEHGQVISCGGGIIKQPENMENLRQNGIVFHIRRNVNALSVGGDRPLSTSREKLREMERERMPLYQKYSDVEIQNNAIFKLAVQKVKEGYDEIFDHKRTEH